MSSKFGGPRELSAAERGAAPAPEKSCVVCGVTTALEVVRSKYITLTVCVEPTACLRRSDASSP